MDDRSGLTYSLVGKGMDTRVEWKEGLVEADVDALMNPDYQWLASGRVPSPVKLGRRALWRFDEIRQWVAAGCPPRSRWKPTLN